MTSKERTTYLNQLADSKLKMLLALHEFSEKDFLTKISPLRWSAAEVLEHVIKVEQRILSQLIEMGKVPSNTNFEEGLSNEEVLRLSSNAEHKSQAREGSLPKGLFEDKLSAIAMFEKIRAESEDFIKTTEIDFETIGAPHPRLGPLNGHNWLVFISGHCLKHVPQIEAIKADLLTGS
ncbi:MAG: DinB family protein [Bacteroidota bacterium]